MPKDEKAEALKDAVNGLEDYCAENLPDHMKFFVLVLDDDKGMGMATSIKAKIARIVLKLARQRLKRIQDKEEALDLIAQKIGELAEEIQEKTKEPEKENVD